MASPHDDDPPSAADILAARLGLTDDLTDDPDDAPELGAGPAAAMPPPRPGHVGPSGSSGPFGSSGYLPGDALHLPSARCRWCGADLEELPSGPWVDDFGSTSCTVPIPGKHWPKVD